MLVAPYVPTMRFGQGFNTFTQGLCVHDAVTAYSKPQAQESRSRPRRGETEDAGPTVSHCAKFVDRISELTDELNTSPYALIKRDATRGTGGVAPLIDPARFHDSDVNFLVRVTVVARHVLEPSLTEFAPIDGVAPADFTGVYGDAFISGFAEGGEFTALVSVKLRGRATADDVRARLAAMFDGAGGPGGGVPESEDALGETTIAVARTGGGDIVGRKTGDWTLTSLRKAAAAFHEHAMHCSVRISALLTKYTDLRSFHASASKTGHPLDYTHAGLYACTLLDEYMDYKLILRDIARAAQEAARGQSTLEARTDAAQFADANARYREQMHMGAKQVVQTHTDDDDDDDDSSSTTTAVGAKRGDKAAIRSNELVPYRADVLGLHKAARECRIEMVKIVQEVDMLAVDPDIAADADRTWRYLSPSVFYTLLPTVKNLTKEEAIRKAAEEAEQVAAAQAAATEDVTRSLVETEQKLESVERMLGQLKPYDFTPAIVGSNVPIRFKSASSGKVFDVRHHNADWLSQWDSEQLDKGHQKFKITQAGVLGFHITHVDTGRGISTNAPRAATADGSIHLAVRQNFASVFVFEDAGDGAVRIRLADQPHYTVVVDGNSRDNRADLVLWPKGEHGSDRWCIEAF